MSFQIRITLIGGRQHTYGNFSSLKKARHNAVVDSTSGHWRQGTGVVKWIFVPARRISKVEIIEI